ncbi:MAG: ribosomal-processing cysteine protease Prp [Tumebacillaceae bacterium]
MIRSIVWRDKQERVCRFSVRGHAESAEYGQDIVCAAVSMLVTNAINSSEHLLGVRIADDTQVKPGDVVCEIPNLQGTDDEKLQLLFEAMVFGIQQVADAYPDFVKISQKYL